MAKKNWRSDPDIQLAKHVAVQQKAVAAIVIWFMPDGAYGVASYGRIGPVCKATGDDTGSAETGCAVAIFGNRGLELFRFP